MPLVINSLGADTQTHTYRLLRTEAIQRNQVRAGLWLACAWFNKNTWGTKRQKLQLSDYNHSYIAIHVTKNFDIRLRPRINLLFRGLHVSK